MDRKEQIIKHLRPEYFLYNSYSLEDVEKDVKKISDLLIKHQIGFMDDVFVFSEREYLELFKYATKEELEAYYEEDDFYKISYKINNFSKENFEKNKDLYIFDYINTFLLDSETSFVESSDNYIPSIKDVENLLSKFKTIQFGKLNGKPIDWIVLNEDDNKLKLMSKYVLKTFTITEKDYISEFNKSSYYKYLNDELYNNSFSDSEKVLFVSDRGSFINLPNLDDISSFNTDYLELCEPCLSDFGRAGIIDNHYVDYVVEDVHEFDKDKTYPPAYYNVIYYRFVDRAGAEFYISSKIDEEDEMEIGLRPVIIIKR